MADIILTLDPSDEVVVLRLGAYLGNRFAQYREVVSSVGGRYDPATNTNRAPINVLPQLIRGLDESGFSADVAGELASLLRHEAEAAGKSLEIGRERATAARDRFAGTKQALYRYQETGIEWTAPRHNAILADEMGLGKTVQALLALPENAAAMVVAPASVRSSWAKECKLWRPDLTPVTVSSRKQARWPVAGEVLILTYGALPEEPSLPSGEIYLVADEAHLLKNRRTKRTARFADLASQVQTTHGYVWMLTGTPLLNRPSELWQLLRVLGLAEKAYGSWFRFSQAFNGYDGPTEEAADGIRKVCLRRRRRDVLQDLPAKTKVTRVVNDLPVATRKMADDVVALLRARGVSLDDVDDAATLTRVAFEQMSAVRSALATAKIPSMLELIESYEDAEEPLVVFSAHRAPIDILGERAGWETITGDTPPEQRGEIVERFQSGALKGVAGTITAMGTGVTLTRASHLLMVDEMWTPALNAQAEDRICRIGQTADSVYVTRLVASHVLEERVHELLAAKQALIEGSVEQASVDAELVPSDAEEITRAALRAAESVADLDARARVDEEARRRQWQAEAKRRAQDLKESGVAVTRDVKVRGRARTAANVIELWAADGLCGVAADDPDYAREQNNVGFSAHDGQFGHSLVKQYQDGGYLTDKQWDAAVRLARKYRRQIGPEPEED